MKKATITWIFVATILVVLLVTMTVLGFSGFLFSLSSSSFETDLKVGTELNIGIKPNETSVKSLSFDGSYLSGEKLKQNINISAEKLTENVFVRVKSCVANGNEQMLFFANDKFSFEEDGYYYCDDVIMGGDKVSFCEYVIMPHFEKLNTNKKNIFTIVVECLSENEDINKIWKKSNNL